ncbi:alcohol dehydrogenase catalytic domain-containing protein [Christensenellaceae bacterium OttesenSCG-928-K19]|nr:alcohol dehydrogenase catalytic domain-containing protein [Christensenellaceae bacterium OttesenSCG-928-K19]
MAKMKAAVFYEPLNMKVEEVDIPEIAANEMLIKVKAVGICGSDVNYYYGNSPVGTADGKGPLILGHETAGVVEDPGILGATMGFKKGDRVAVNPVAPCFGCVPCLSGEFNECDNVNVYGVSADGAFAEYTKATASNVYKIPDDMSFEGGGLAEPLACANHSARKLHMQPGMTTVVFGCGAIGLMDVQLVRACGSGKVIAVDVDDYKLDMAIKLGADYAINTMDKNSKYYTDNIAARVKEVNGGRLAHRALLPTGAMSAWQQALEVTRPASTIVYFGQPSSADAVLNIPALEALQMDRNIGFAWLAPLVWDNVFNELANGQVKVDDIITHRFSLDDIVEGIKFMRESKEKKIKGMMIID